MKPILLWYHNSLPERGITMICKNHNKLKCLTVTVFLLISLIALLSIGPIQVVRGADPHIVTGVVYEANATLCENCNVTITNTRTGESENTTSNATAVYAFNLLNLLSGWAFGDTIQVTAYNDTGVNGTNSTTIKVGTTSTTIDVWIGTTQVTHGVNFYIIDQDGYPGDNAFINIKDNSGDIVVTKMTDSYGKASADLDTGLYTITVSKSGFDDVIQKIKVYGSTYSIRIGGKEAVGITTGDLCFWAFIILIVIFIVAILAYAFKKVG